MPSTVIELMDTLATVTRPIVINIVDRLKGYLDLPPDLDIIYPGDFNVLQQSSSDTQRPQAMARFNEGNRMMITVTERVNNEQLLTMDVNQFNHPSVFSDPAIGCYLVPIYSTTDLKIAIRATFNSRTEAYQWQGAMLRKVSQLGELALHSVSYHYSIPRPALSLIKTIHGLREQSMPYGDSLMDYIVEHSRPTLSLVSDTAGQHIELTIPEIQTRIIGFMEGDSTPEPFDRDEQGGIYTVEFTYQIRYEKPVSIYCLYPIMVHNQLLPYIYLDHILQNQPKHYDGYYSRMDEPLGHFDQSLEYHGVYHERVHTLHLPPEDIFIPQSIECHVPLMTFLCQIGPDDDYLIDLKDLPLVVIDPDLLDYMLTIETKYLTHLHSSLLQFQLYIDDDLQPAGSLRVLPNGRCVSSLPIDRRKIYRIVFYLNTDPSLVSDHFFNRIKNYPKVILKLLMIINDRLVDYPEFKRLWGEHRFTDRELDTLYRWFISANWNNPSRSMGRHSPRHFDLPEIMKGLFTPPEGYTVMMSHITIRNDKTYFQ